MKNIIKAFKNNEPKEALEWCGAYVMFYATTMGFILAPFVAYGLIDKVLRFFGI